MSGFDRSSRASRSTISRAAASGSRDGELDPPPDANGADAFDREVGEAPLDRPALGIEDPGLGGDVDGDLDLDAHRAITSSSTYRREARAGDPFEGLVLSCPRSGDDVVRQIRPRRRSRRDGWPSSQSRTNCLSKLAWAAGGVRRRLPEARRIGGQDLVDEDQLAVDEAQLELGVGEDDADRLAVARRPPVQGKGNVTDPLGEVPRRPDVPGPDDDPLQRRVIASKSMFSSCAPASAFVAGVRIGSGRRSLSRSPDGSSTPQTAPRAWYSFQPEPER